MQDNIDVDNREMTKLQLALDKLLTEEATGISITPNLGTGNQSWQIILDEGVKAIYKLNEKVEEVQFISTGMETGRSETSVTEFLRTKKSKEDIYAECFQAYIAAKNQHTQKSVDVDLSDLETGVGVIVLTKKSSSSTTIEQQSLGGDTVEQTPDKPFYIDDIVDPDEPFEILEKQYPDFDIVVEPI